MFKTKKYLSAGLFAVASAAALGQVSTSYISKPAIAQTTRVEVADLNTKIGATCFVYRNGPNPVNLTEGTLKAASDTWIVVTTRNDANTPFETWIPVQNVQQIEFPPPPK